MLVRGQKWEAVHRGKTVVATVRYADNYGAILDVPEGSAYVRFRQLRRGDAYPAPSIRPIRLLEEA